MSRIRRILSTLANAYGVPTTTKPMVILRRKNTAPYYYFEYPYMKREK